MQAPVTIDRSRVRVTTGWSPGTYLWMCTVMQPGITAMPACWMRPPGYSSRLPATPTRGSATASSSGSSQPSCTSVSRFSSTTTSPVAACTPWLHAAANPMFTGLVMTVARPAHSAHSAGVPSVDALSTITSSARSRVPVRWRDARHAAVRSAR